MTKVYFHRPSRICELTAGRLKLSDFCTSSSAASSAISNVVYYIFDASSISRTHPGTFMHPLYLVNG